MNKIQQFAADLKARKGVGKRTTRNDAPAHTPPAALSGLRRSSTIERLKRELHDAKERADKAEAALAAVEKINAEVWRLNQTIARLRGRRNRPGRLDVALQRIAELEEQLRNTPNGETA